MATFYLAEDLEHDRRVGVVQNRCDLVRSDPRFAAILRRLNLDVARLTLPDGGRSR